MRATQCELPIRGIFSHKCLSNHPWAKLKCSSSPFSVSTRKPSQCTQALRLICFLFLSAGPKVTVLWWYSDIVREKHQCINNGGSYGRGIRLPTHAAYLCSLALLLSTQEAPLLSRDDFLLGLCKVMTLLLWQNSAYGGRFWPHDHSLIMRVSRRFNSTSETIFQME